MSGKSQLGHVRSFTVKGYRSIRRLDIAFGDVNVVTGPNGCGKSNLFNAFRLVKSATEGRLSRSIAEEGGMGSVMWAGVRDKGPGRTSIALEAEPFEYELELGIRPMSEFPVFPHDPQIKAEKVKLARKVMVDRKSSIARIYSSQGRALDRIDLLDSESIFAQIGDPEDFHYLYTLKEMVARWTFYHEFRTDADSPIRRPCIPTFSPRLSDSGDNLAAIMLLIQKQGEIDRMGEILHEAFPSSTFYSNGTELEMKVDGVYRAFGAKEFSDGTLKFLALVVACFAPRPAPLMAFNEPETSLNPGVYGALADAFAHASQYSQLWVTTHSEALNTALQDRLGCKVIRLDKVDGETLIAGTRKGSFHFEDEED
ncbi:MAG TPA: AAA family ATPase [Fimbriimonadaceae bacterium]|jgi:predicted ATPase